MRILCLHGCGTNSDVFEAQLAPLINRLPKNYKFDFLDGEHTVAAAPGIGLLHPGPYFAWHRRHFTKDIQAAHDYINSVIEEDGPYDGVIGYSQGAALAASLLLSQLDRQPHRPRPFRFAIFICSVMPVSPSRQVGTPGTSQAMEYEEKFAEFFGLSRKDIATGPGSEVVHFYKPVGSIALSEDTSGADTKIDIPTLHLLGAQDQFLSFGHYLVNLCEEWKTEVVVSQCGHELPRSKDSIDRAAALVERLVESSNLDY
ncbi:hypothetical protein GQ53DRAFT_728710 [Thozetella sp. PMI_491]|nr:hypothetical protein GQ53DRAFT_728710 [Thozetella sp. PMI_491]